MEFDQRVIIRFLCKDRVSLEDIHAHIEAEFGDATYSEQSVQWWCQYVRQRREDLHDEVQSGRPPIDFLDIRILVLLNQQPFHSAYSIAEALGVSHSTVLSHLRESLGLKNFHLRWIHTSQRQPATDSDGNSPRVIAHSQDSQKLNCKDL
jgi:DNA-binding transcriptional ArsR family regulator